MKIIAGILYHIFARLCPQIALSTLKFLDQFSCRLYRNHRCCGTGGKGGVQRTGRIERTFRASLILSYLPGPDLLSPSQITIEGRQVHQAVS